MFRCWFLAIFLVIKNARPYFKDYCHNAGLQWIGDGSGSTDEEVIKIAFAESRVLITNDKDFGEKVFSKGKQHVGIILLRLANERSKNKIKVLKQVLDKHGKRLENSFIVAREGQIRIVDQ